MKLNSSKQGFSANAILASFHFDSTQPQIFERFLWQQESIRESNRSVTIKPSNASEQDPEFDAFAKNYDEALQEGLDLTGESKEYFAQHRVKWITQQLAAYEATTDSILDFGCGTGGSVDYLLKQLNPKRLVGTDVSDDSLKIARVSHQDNRCHFERLDKFEPRAELDLAFCNGVFHHIPLSERQQCVQTIFDALTPQGYFCYWENNPWNPGTRWVMKRVPFDRDAIMLWPSESRQMLRRSGFEIVTTNYCFFFPNFLRALRPLEAYLSHFPLGGQYLVIAKKP